jgi:phage terminase large subunit
MLFIANPQSAEDPFSKRFIVPFQEELDTNGVYEDELHLIMVINYTDNPWFMESGLEQERQWAYKTLDRSLYDHIWLGKYNDSIEGSIIRAEWFDACIDAHKVLGFEPSGAKIAAHDPSDTGPDSKGYAMRYGSVFLDIQEKTDGDGNEGGHWAAGIANSQNVDYFTWDGDGMGCLLNEQMAHDFKDKPTKLVMFKGSETPDNPESIYNPALKSPVADQVMVKDAVKNKRAQYYAELRDRVYRTYLAVVKGEYHDPDTLISFDSSIALLSKLRAELCRMPIKPNGAGKIDLYTKDEMKSSKFNFPSPNLGDSVMMSMRYTKPSVVKPYIPRSIKSMGVGRR